MTGNVINTDLTESLKWGYQNREGNFIFTTKAELKQLFQEGNITEETRVGWENGPWNGFAYKDIDAKYYFEQSGSILPIYDDDELYRAVSENRIKATTMIWGKNIPPQGLPFSSLKFTDLKFSPDIKQFIENRRDKLNTVFSGPNNSGKTLLLKLLRREFGPSAQFLACNRFYHLDRLNPAIENSTQNEQLFVNFITQLYQSRQNLEQSDFQLDQLLSRMKDVQRDRLLKLCSEMLGIELKLEQVDPENKLSQFYIKVEGQTLAISSTGTRLLIVIIAACLNNRHNILLIDEPELGLSPRLQTVLSRYFFDKELRRDFFPHLNQLFIATHSHLFLDRNDIYNNFVVTRTGEEVKIDKVRSMDTFHELQFTMLGNDLESLFLPTAIVIVEGETDYKYLKRVLQTKLPNKFISVVKADGDGGIQKKLHTIKESLGDLRESPYHNRIFILLDKRNSVLLSKLTSQGIDENQVKVLSENGIEFYYPPEILSNIFHCNEEEVYKLLKINDNTIRIGEIEKAKVELCNNVIDRMNSTSKIPEELYNKLLDPLSKLYD